jgi:hypothetical protein
MRGRRGYEEGFRYCMEQYPQGSWMHGPVWNERTLILKRVSACVIASTRGT